MVNKISSKLRHVVEKLPFKVLFTALAIVALLITRLLKVDMATGNKTLVKTESESYI